MQDDPNQEETKDVPKEFNSFKKGESNLFSGQKKSDNAKSGHAKNFYGSGFKLE